MLPLAWALNIEYAPKRYRSTIVTVIMIGYSAGARPRRPDRELDDPALRLAVRVRRRWRHSARGDAGASGSMLPESIRFLASQGRRAAAGRGPAAPHDRQERFPRTRNSCCRRSRPGQGFQARLLFRGHLRVITPLLWLAYFASSMAVFFLATWTPLVFEALNFPATCGVRRLDEAWPGAVGGLLLMRFTDHRGRRSRSPPCRYLLFRSAGRRLRRCRPQRLFWHCSR